MSLLCSRPCSDSPLPLSKTSTLSMTCTVLSCDLSDLVSTYFPSAQSAPATPASLLFPEHTRRAPVFSSGTRCSLCLEHSSPRSPHGSLFYHLQIFARVSLLTEAHLDLTTLLSCNPSLHHSQSPSVCSAFSFSHSSYDLLTFKVNLLIIDFIIYRMSPAAGI